MAEKKAPVHQDPNSRPRCQIGVEVTYPLNEPPGQPIVNLSKGSVAVNFLHVFFFFVSE